MRYELHHLASYHQKANIEEYKEHRIFRTNKKNQFVIPTGIKAKSAILFSMFLMILSRPLFKNIPELVRTLQKKKKIN